MNKHTVVRRLVALSLGAVVLVQGAAVFVEASAYAAGQAAGQGPKATLMRLNGSVDKLLRMKTEPGSTEEKKAKDEIKQRASELLDYSELTKRALGEHWEKMPAPKREEFVKTLQELIERNYVRQLRTNLEYEVTYGDEQIDPPAGGVGEARVTTTIKIATRGKSTTAQIEYRMIQREPGAGTKDAVGWRVYDVVTDELSLVRNYRSQFQRIIGQQGYDGLLTRMKTKLTEEQAKEAKDAAAAKDAPKDGAAPKAAPSK